MPDIWRNGGKHKVLLLLIGWTPQATGMPARNRGEYLVAFLEKRERYHKQHGTYDAIFSLMITPPKERGMMWMQSFVAAESILAGGVSGSQPFLTNGIHDMR